MFAGRELYETCVQDPSVGNTFDKTATAQFVFRIYLNTARTQPTQTPVQLTPRGNSSNAVINLSLRLIAALKTVHSAARKIKQGQSSHFCDIYKQVRLSSKAFKLINTLITDEVHYLQNQTNAPCVFVNFLSCVNVYQGCNNRNISPLTSLFSQVNNTIKDA